jgi:hypothetical protein
LNSSSRAIAAVEACERSQEPTTFGTADHVVAVIVNAICPSVEVLAAEESVSAEHRIAPSRILDFLSGKQDFHSKLFEEKVCRLSATDHMLWLQLRQGKWEVATLERWAASAASDAETSSSDMMQRNTRVSAVCRNKNATRVSATVCVRAAISRRKV